MAERGRRPRLRRIEQLRARDHLRAFRCDLDPCEFAEFAEAQHAVRGAQKTRATECAAQIIAPKFAPARDVVADEFGKLLALSRESKQAPVPHERRHPIHSEIRRMPRHARRKILRHLRAKPARRVRLRHKNPRPLPRLRRSHDRRRRIHRLRHLRAMRDSGEHFPIRRINHEQPSRRRPAHASGKDEHTLAPMQLRRDGRRVARAPLVRRGPQQLSRRDIERHGVHRLPLMHAAELHDDAIAHHERRGSESEKRRPHRILTRAVMLPNHFSTREIQTMHATRNAEGEHAPIRNHRTCPRPAAPAVPRPVRRLVVKFPARLAGRRIAALHRFLFVQPVKDHDAPAGNRRSAHPAAERHFPHGMQTFRRKFAAQSRFGRRAIVRRPEDARPFRADGLPRERHGGTQRGECECME